MTESWVHYTLEIPLITINKYIYSAYTMYAKHYSKWLININPLILIITQP